MKITPLVLAPQLPLDGITSGIFPYLGGSVSVDLLRSVVMAYEGVIVPGRQGAKLAAKTPGVLIDPAVYAPQGRTEQETLFDYDDWLMRQKAAGVPLHSHRLAPNPEQGPVGAPESAGAVGRDR